jgi:hypothetical protein
MRATEIWKEAQLRPSSLPYFWAAMNDDWATAEAQYADDIEWDMMPNNHIRKGKNDVIPWL